MEWGRRKPLGMMSKGLFQVLDGRYDLEGLGVIDIQLRVLGHHQQVAAAVREGEVLDVAVQLEGLSDGLTLQIPYFQSLSFCYCQEVVVVAIGLDAEADAAVSASGSGSSGSETPSSARHLRRSACSK